MFWKNKIKNVPEKTNVISVDKKTEKPGCYVEIFRLTQQQVRLDQLALAIDDIRIRKDIQHAGLMHYQMSVKEAYIAEFEKEYQAMFNRTMRYPDYKRTRSTLQGK